MSKKPIQDKIFSRKIWSFSKILMLIVVLLLISTCVSAKTKLVSVEENDLKITSWEDAECNGIICNYEFVIENYAGNDIDLDVSSIFEKEIEIIKFEKWGEVSKVTKINNPYVCGYDDVNGTNASQPIYCDNVSSTVNTYPGWVVVESEQAVEEKAVLENVSVEKKAMEKAVKADIVKSDKVSRKVLAKASSKSKLKANKLDLKEFDEIQDNRYRVTVRQPLGSKTKFDIVATKNDGVKTVLDPWVDTENYYISLSAGYSDDFTQDSFTDVGSLIFVDTTNERMEYSLQRTGTQDHYSYKALDSMTSFPRITFELETGTFGGGNYGSICLSSAYGDYATMNSAESMCLDFYATTVDTVRFIDTEDSSATSLYGLSDNTVYQIEMYEESAGTLNCSIFNSDKSVRLFSQDVSISNIDVSNLGYFVFAVHDTNSVTTKETHYVDDLSIGGVEDNIYYPTENLSINSSQDSVVVAYDSNVVLSLNDTALGTNLENGGCYKVLDTELDWAIKVDPTYDLSRVVNYTFGSCSVNESEGIKTILEGISESEIDGANTVYYDKTIFSRHNNGSQYYGAFDLYVTAGNKRYAFNYEENSSAVFPVMYNISPIFYVWQYSNLSKTEVENSVRNWIDGTN